ncbi:MAG TPA: selenocysteine-specific translation elongation factor [Candidatus Krumholzibacteria bacterium]|nr:selenocysteine-specific translation elongation factor [Candidatus Krumholzibacteria bacterium]
MPLVPASSGSPSDVTSAPGNTSAPAARHFILGTAGHVDHGKTELVRALTGHDTDRLKEEKERGISIELGFAPFPLSDDLFIGIIDVPGHERFVRQMVAGAGGIDLGMLLVAADEGVMPQTREHLEVLRALGLRHGLVVISKSDLATDETLPLLHEEIAELVHGSFLEGAPVVPASARTGAGLDDLRAALLALARTVENRDTSGPFRLAVDRVFHQKGIGVVVTGSCYSGRVAPGDEFDLLPSGTRVRVRELQSFGARRAAGAAGERLAIALHGVKLEDVARGDMLATPGRFLPADTVDARVSLASLKDLEIRNRERIRIHHGARELLGRVVLLEGDVLRAGASALAQIRLETPMVAGAGDRLVIRKYSPPRVIGGGVVIEPRAEKHARRDAAVIDRLRIREQGDPETVLAKTVERAGLAGVVEAEADPAAAAALVSRHELVALAGRFYHRHVLDDLAARVVEFARAHQARHPLQWGVGKEELRQRLSFPHAAATFNRVIELLGATHPLFLRGDRVREGTPDIELPPALARAVVELNEFIRAAGIAYPSRADIERAWSSRDRVPDALQYLRDAGEIVEAGDGYIHASSFARCVEAVRRHFAAKGELAVSDLRDALGVTRKHAVPLLELLDARRVTVRKGDVRVPGSALNSHEDGR